MKARPIRIVIGADPGFTTGLARYDLDTREAQLVQVEPGHDVLKALQYQLLRRTDVAVLLAVEAFVVGPRAARSSTARAGHVTRNLVGGLQAFGLLRGMRVVLRSASDVKPWASDDRLRAAGLYQRGVPHARDAARHALYAAVRDCGMSDPLSRAAR